MYITLIKDRNRNFSSYFPEGRVKSAIFKGFKANDNKTQCILQCHEITKTQMDKMVEEGDIDFDKSKAQTEVKTYFFESKNQLGSDVIFEIQLNDTVATLNYFHHLTFPKDCDC